MTLRRLKWLAVLAPLLYLGSLELLRDAVAPHIFREWLTSSANFSRLRFITMRPFDTIAIVWARFSASVRM